jgi:hypothetical protein
MFLEEIKLMLGDAANNYTDGQITLAYKMSVAEIEEYCNRELDTTLEYIATQIAVIKLNRMSTEGLASTSISGVSESYLDGYPAHIQQVLTRKRKIKVV